MQGDASRIFRVNGLAIKLREGSCIQKMFLVYVAATFAHRQTSCAERHQAMADFNNQSQIQPL
jgi:hypothetical protein